MIFRALDMKMWRDLWQMRGQALAIALVITSGVATYIMFLSTLDSLRLTQASFYQDYRFAEVFAPLKRAPKSLVPRIREIPAVAAVEARVAANVTLDVAGFDEPVNGRLVSLPDGSEPLLNRLYLRQGRMPNGTHHNEVLVSDAFAGAHGLHPGDRLTAIMNGRRQSLTIVGIAISPEYIYQLRPGSAWPDYERYGIVWMGESAVANAFDMDGAFNDLTLSLSEHSRYQEVIDRLDLLLETYGGIGAYEREEQLSNKFLMEEFKQIERNATIFPVIFLAVAVFLLNVVINRMVATQREQIASLKAFGYRNRDIAIHYLKLVLVIVAVGVVAGVGIGAWLGKGLSDIYIEFYRFPYLIFELQTDVVVGAAVTNALAAVAGTLWAVRVGATLHPAEAMRPAAPVVYRQTWVERLGVGRYLSQPNRMILRHIERRPFKSLLMVIGIALAGGINMTGQFQQDTINHMMDLHYGLSQRQDVMVIFSDPTSARAVYDLLHLPGVERAEPFRHVPVRFRNGHRSHQTGILGVRSDGDLHRLLDTELQRVRLPEEGVILTDYLGEMLGVGVGDRITAEILEGSREKREVTVVALVQEYLGVSGYMALPALNRLLEEGYAINGAFLAVDSAATGELLHELKEVPRVAIINQRALEIENFNKTMDKTMIFITTIATIFAVIISFGVIYNSARIALTERGRELASLRVLGFTRGEIAYILLGELALLTLVAIPAGWWVGYALCDVIATSLQSELYRVPTILHSSTYAYATCVVLLAAIASGVLVRRQLDRLDLIGVLKTKE